MSFTTLKAWAKGLLYTSGAIALARTWGEDGNQMPILRYHSVSPPGPDAHYRSPYIAVSPGLFDRQLRYLKARYRVISLDQAVDCLGSGKRFPRHATAITFDDGYLDNYQYAYPALRRHGLTATFFLTAGPVVRGDRFWIAWLRQAIFASRTVDHLAREFSLAEAGHGVSESERRHRLVRSVAVQVNRARLAERPAILARVEAALGDLAGVAKTADYMLSPHHVREMVAGGMTIGSHTVSHPILSSLTDAEARQEMEESRVLLEEVTGTPVVHLAYPNGPGVQNFNQRTGELARASGYRSASTSVNGALSLGSDPFAVERQGIDDPQGFAGFALRLVRHRFKRTEGVRA